MTYLDEAGLLDYFDQIISTAMVPHGKPMPDVYRYACKCIGEKPEACIALEDSPNGLMAAYRAGMSAHHGTGSYTAGCEAVEDTLRKGRFTDGRYSVSALSNLSVGLR